MNKTKFNLLPVQKKLYDEVRLYERILCGGWPKPGTDSRLMAALIRSIEEYNCAQSKSDRDE